MAAKKRMRSNFRQAMNELVNGETPVQGRDRETEGEAEGQVTVSEEPGTDELEIIELGNQAENAAVSAGESIQENIAQARQEHPARAEMEKGAGGDMRLESIITEDMVIEGNIITRSDLKLFGTVTGDVTCEGYIYMTGSIEGEVTADSLKMQSGRIQGNVHSSQDIIIEREAEIKGDVGCRRLIMNGQVEGSIQTTESIELQEAAVLIGNAASGNISVHNGAKVKGLIEIGEV